MKAIIGLGNMGEQYNFTRHNIGFMVLDKIALNNNLIFKEEKKFKAFLTKLKYNNNDILLVKPATFMNLSGDAVQLITNYYKINPEDIIVIFDDLSINLGTLRFKNNGSHGGHNGIKSIINCLNTTNIPRLKIGIGPQPPIPAEKFVLQKFNNEQLVILKEVINLSTNALFYYFDNDIYKAQNKYN